MTTPSKACHGYDKSICKLEEKIYYLSHHNRRQESRDLIAEQIKLAVIEALCDENPEIQEYIDDGYKEGLRAGELAMLEKAKQKAKEHECSITRGSAVCNCDLEIADAIDSLTPVDPKGEK